MKPTLLLLPLVLLMAACVPSTPDARIAAAPAAFESLSPQHKALVRQGRIDTGMRPEAVRLAWGNPSREYEGADGDRETRVWEYDRTKPVYTTSYYSAYTFGRYGYRSHVFDIGPEITYVPTRAATVWFRGDRVSKWERVR